jgi:outer membrane protein assembly factor BamD (BamD/ComL family)
LGEVYSRPNFAGMDYARSQFYFEKLVENFPDSELVPEAKTYISLFETIAAKEKEVAAAEQKSGQEVKEAKKEKIAGSVSETPQIVENKNFAEAVARNLQILEESGTNKPADEALYNLGLIYAHVDNPAKDYRKAQTYFYTLTEQFPDSELAEEARIWLGLFETIEKIQQIDIEIEQQKKQLTR